MPASRRARRISAWLRRTPATSTASRAMATASTVISTAIRRIYRPEPGLHGRVGGSRMPASRRPVLGAVGVLLAVSVWGGVAVVAKLVDGINGTVLGFHRLWIGTLVTLAVFTARGGRLSSSLLRDCAAGGIAFGLDIVLFFSALKHTTVANATVIGALQPALLFVVVGRLFGERVTKTIVGWTAVAIAGVAVVMYGSSGTPAWSPFGDLLAFGALLAWTAYFVASKQARRRRGALEYLTGLLI